MNSVTPTPRQCSRTRPSALVWLMIIPMLLKIDFSATYEAGARQDRQMRRHGVLRLLRRKTGNLRAGHRKPDEEGKAHV
jgi:hypothetical protein